MVESFLEPGVDDEAGEDAIVVAEEHEAAGGSDGDEEVERAASDF